ncbi:HTH-type transcriptional repressor PurR [Arthrobacter sp. Hiyo8]|nr:HTH-type transcriptional repressor PurR [Arthrobacter sp. Hiyo8]
MSYVVNGGPKKVAPATEAKVQEAIRILGYRPNAAARALKMGSNQTIGLVIPDSSNPFWALLGHAVEVAAAERGYALLLTNSDNKLDSERRHIRNLADRQVDGVVLASVMFEPDLLELFGTEIRSVLLNHASIAPGFNSVGVDLEAGARLAVEHLIGHGHTNIGLAMGITADNVTDGREEGWLRALQAAGLPPGPLARDGFDRPGAMLPDGASWPLPTVRRRSSPAPICRQSGSCGQSARQVSPFRRISPWRPSTARLRLNTPGRP